MRALRVSPCKTRGRATDSSPFAISIRCARSCRARARWHFWICPWMGVAALVGAILLIGLTLLTEAFTHEPTNAATALAAQRNALAESSCHNAEVLHAMGMAPQLGALWNEVNVKYLDAHQRASDVGGALGAISKVMRMVLQSAMLGIGALLVIQQQ